jgi:hypothetical protein
MAVRDDGAEMVTGGADAALCVWRDATVEQRRAEQDKDEFILLQQQKLDNLVRGGKHTQALTLAIAMDQPHRALVVLFALLSSSGDAAGDDPKNPHHHHLLLLHNNHHSNVLCELMRGLSREELLTLMSWIKDWNTNAKFASVTQPLLTALFSVFSASSLAKLPQMRGLLQALIPYSQRHEQRLKALRRNAYLLDYTLAEMQLPAAVEADDQPQQQQQQQSVIISSSSSRAPLRLPVPPVIGPSSVSADTHQRKQKRRTQEDDDDDDESGIDVSQFHEVKEKKVEMDNEEEDVDDDDDLNDLGLNAGDTTARESKKASRKNKKRRTRSDTNSSAVTTGYSLR